MKHPTVLRTLATSACVALLVVACDGLDDSAEARRNAAPDGADGGPSVDPTQPGSCKVGTAHLGFGGTDFVGKRQPGALGEERRRVKPYSALTTEFQRALGQVPAGMAGSVAAFGIVPARWYAEPGAGAVSVYTTYGLAFSGCYDTMTDASYAQAPTAATAAAECARMQRKFWQRTPTPDETTECVDLAVTDFGAEPVARRRWAHACASLLTAARFTSY